MFPSTNQSYPTKPSLIGVTGLLYQSWEAAGGVISIHAPIMTPQSVWEADSSDGFGGCSYAGNCTTLFSKSWPAAWCPCEWWALWYFGWMELQFSLQMCRSVFACTFGLWLTSETIQVVTGTQSLANGLCSACVYLGRCTMRVSNPLTPCLFVCLCESVGIVLCTSFNSFQCSVFLQ